MLVRLGAYAWSIVGIALALIIVAVVFVQLRIVTIPLALALFPATVLIPVVRRMQSRGLRSGLAATIAMVSFLLVFAGVIALTVNAVQREGPELVQSAQDGYELLREGVEEGLLGLPAFEFEEVLEQVQTWAVEEFGETILPALVATFEGLIALVFGLVALFFYLRDGPRIAGWMHELFPPRFQQHAAEIGVRSWRAIGGYIRGQSIVAFGDAVFIGIGLVILGVPLAFVLSVLIFFGAYVPVVGAFVTGALAVLVALASEGPFIALLTFLVVLGVQQVESNLLAPMVLGRSMALHPLAVLVALTVGAILYGIIGAILAVPIAAIVARAGGYWREIAREPSASGQDAGRPTDGEADAGGEPDPQPAGPR